MFYLHKHNPFLYFHPRFFIQKLDSIPELVLRGGCWVTNLSECMLKRGGTGKMNRDKQGGGRQKLEVSSESTF